MSGAGKPRSILVVRFRQMGDAIVATSLLSTLHESFGDAEIDFVLNDRIAPLFEGHPAIRRVIAFSDADRHHFATFIRKVWRVTHERHYDVVIDLRSTANTMLFALLAPRPCLRIGLRKPYTWGVFDRRVGTSGENESMIDHNLKFARQLSTFGELKVCRDLSLGISQAEREAFRAYMAQEGIDFGRPVVLVGVTTRLDNKSWPSDRMTALLDRLTATYPGIQLVFNLAPGREAEKALGIYKAMGSKKGIFVNILAKSSRELAAMAANCDVYFGNEGGSRHIVQAMGKPSFVICSPLARRRKWVPADTSVPALAIEADDIAPTTGLTLEEKYALITVDAVWERLRPFLDPFL